MGCLGENPPPLAHVSSGGLRSWILGGYDMYYKTFWSHLLFQVMRLQLKRINMRPGMDSGSFYIFIF